MALAPPHLHSQVSDAPWCRPDAAWRVAAGPILAGWMDAQGGDYRGESENPHLDVATYQASARRIWAPGLK
eukprot:scaffold21841_cov155-Isochrysis_galbana.AAC.3